jgi:ribonuclease HI
MTQKVLITSLNVRKSRAATADVASSNGWDVLCLQEPYSTKEGNLQITGAFYCMGEGKTRAAIVSKLPGTRLLPAFSNEDICTVTYGEGKIWIVSAYCDQKEQAVPQLVRTVVSEARRKGIKLILQADSNSHSPLWGSQETNRRGEEWEEWIFDQDLEVANVGDTNTFQNEQGQSSHIDVTVHTGRAVITRWRVDEGPMVSDHRKIHYELEGEGGSGMTWEERGNKWNFKKADWNLFKETIATRLSGGEGEKDGSEVNQMAAEVTEIIQEALEKACPAKRQITRKPVPWWKPSLSDERKDVNKKYRKWKKHGREGDGAEYKEALQDYKASILECKEKSWREFCTEANKGEELAALARAVKRAKPQQHALVEGADTPQEHAKMLLQSHFPGMDISDEEPQTGTHSCDQGCGVRGDKNKKLIGSITEERVKKVFESFGPNKAAGEDGIRPLALQNLPPEMVKTIAQLYRNALIHGVMPTVWSKMKVVFIPKPGKDTSSPKGYRPITLSSFLLKGLEKAILWHLQENNLVKMSSNQHAYTTGKSCDTALLEVTNHLEKGRGKGKHAVVVALDASGAFDRLSFEMAEEAMKTFRWPTNLAQFYSKLLRSRRVKSGGVEGTPTRGTPQGGILSPTLWNMAADLLLRKSGPRGTTITGYADDLLLTAAGKDEKTTARNMQTLLAKARDWGETAGIDFNPAKTEMMLVSKKRKISPPRITMEGVPLECQRSIKYLGVVIDDKLTFGAHIRQKIAKATKLLYHCKTMIGAGWGLNNSRIWWAYDSLVRSLMAHGACVHSTGGTITKALRKRLASLQRKVLLMMTRAMRGTPTAGMEVALGIPPLHLWLKKRGLETRLRVNQSLSAGARARNEKVVANATSSALSTCMPIDHTKELNREAEGETPPSSGRRFTTYTDGSRKEEKTGYAWLMTRGLQVVAEGDGYLGETGTVFQAEIMAISTFLEWLLQPERSQKLRRGDMITIRSDSQSGIAALESRTLTSKVVAECKERLNRARKKYDIQIEWVRGHDNDTGNEAADAAAKAAAEKRWEGSEPWGPVPFSWVKRKLGETLEEEWKREWEERGDCRQTKAMLGKPTLETWSKMKMESRGRLRTWIGFTTGHTHMRRHLAIVLEKEGSNTSCRLCDGAEETPLHMMRCPALDYERIKYVALRSFLPVKEALFTYIDDAWSRIGQTKLNDTPPDL